MTGWVRRDQVVWPWFWVVAAAIAAATTVLVVSAVRSDPGPIRQIPPNSIQPYLEPGQMFYDGRIVLEFTETVRQIQLLDVRLQPSEGLRIVETFLVGPDRDGHTYDFDLWPLQASDPLGDETPLPSDTIIDEYAGGKGYEVIIVIEPMLGKYRSEWVEMDYRIGRKRYRVRFPNITIVSIPWDGAPLPTPPSE